MITARRIKGTRRAGNRALRLYSFEVNYGGTEVYPYYFRAKSRAEVARATGIDEVHISEINPAHIQRGRHIDTVVNGQLVE